jgi:hypothetical protein
MLKASMLLIATALALPLSAAADPRDATTTDPNAPASVPGGPRVRPTDGRSAALLVEGLRRSETMRSIVEQLESRNVIVYVRMQPSLAGRWAGSLTWIAATSRFRYVQVALSPQLRRTAAIAALGHELHHALEVANEPSIVSPGTLNDYYRRHGIMMRTQNNGWDTEAARIVGDDVRRDLGGTAAAIETIHDFDPSQWFEIYRRARQR